MTAENLLEPDRDQIEIFVDALFRHAGEGGYVSLRSFLFNNKVLKPIRAVVMNGNGNGSLIELINVAEDLARRAANNQEPAVFCPPIAVFHSSEGWRAREQDLFKGLALSVECDEHPDEARWRLEEILGPATAVVRSGGTWLSEDGPKDKLHLHWRLKQPAMGEALAKLKQARELATTIVGGDPSNITAVHCLRWPGSWHRKGEPRLCEMFLVNPDAEIDLDTALAALKAAAPALAQGGSREGESDPAAWGELAGNIVAGKNLHDSILRLAAKLVRSGMAAGAAVNQLRGLMDISAARQERPDEWKERYEDIPRAVETGEQKYTPEPADTVEPCTIGETLAVFDKWLILPSRTPVYAMLGTVAANLLPGDPVWLGIIGPGSSAKTEILNSTSMLPYVVQAATLTPAGLLSGTPKKQCDKGARGGLLRQIGDFGIISLKDFGSILSMRPDTKPEVLAALREIYDGEWTRHLGSDGGRTLHWKGKVGLLFGATGVIDSHHSVIGAMGERFLMSRLAPLEGQFKRALQHAGDATKQMRKELAEAVARLFAGQRPEPRPLSEQEIERIDRVVSLVVKLRGPVERDRYTRELEAVYGAEGTARVGLTLERLLAGLDTLGVDRETALQVVESVAMDSVPPIRREAYEYLGSDDAENDRELAHGPEDPQTHTKEIIGSGVPTSAVGKALGLPTNTVRRALEDLTAYGLTKRISQGQGKADLWDSLSM
jgi:hypothetical protein